MVGILLLVDLRWTASTSMQSKDERISVGWYGPNTIELELHGLIPECDGALLDEHAVELGQF